MSDRSADGNSAGGNSAGTGASGLRGLLLTILAGLLGIGGVSWGFLAGIDAALSGSGSGSGPFVALFVLGAVLVIGTVVSAVLGLFSRGHRVLWSVALALGLLPVVAVIVLAVNARG